MVDTLCSDSDGTPLKTSETVGIEISESAVPPIQDGRAKPIRVDEALSSLDQSVLVFEISAMDISKGDSFSVCDSKDTSSTGKKNKRRDKKNRRKDRDLRATGLPEGQQRGEMEREGASVISSELRLMESSCFTDASLATARTALEKHTAMERTDVSPSYTSDEWDVESSDSDTDGDHTDSSDDDDPKSQVDRLIERGTLMYVEAENSALSSEDESDYEYDSESDITDVSPLGSATASPVGLSPVLPRRMIPTSPLALHDNRDLGLSFSYDPHRSPFNWDNPGESRSTNNIYNESTDNSHDSTNMDLLLQAVIELENKNNAKKYNNLNRRNHHHHHPPDSQELPEHPSDQVFIHPIRDNPHHSHLRKNYSRRKNMSFSNEEVRKIDRDNKILLKKIMAAHSRPKTSLAGAHHHHHHNVANRSNQKSSNSAINRKKGEEKIRKENLILLKKIQEVKPSKDMATADRRGVEPLMNVSNRSLRSPSSSCGAFMRSLSQPSHVAVPPPRKETAL